MTDTIKSLKQQLAECQAELQKVTEQKNAMWFSAAEAQATNGKLLKALETIKQYLRSGNAIAAYNYLFVALAIPSDATALNERIAESTKALKAEAERLRLDNLKLCDSFATGESVNIRSIFSLKQQNAKLIAEVEQLTEENFALAADACPIETDVTLRDLFALQAMSIFLHQDLTVTLNAQMGAQWVCRESYRMADVMLAARDAQSIDSPCATSHNED